MKFKYYIVDTAGGNVTGTDNADLAHFLATNEDLSVIDAENGLWLSAWGEADNIKESESVVEEGEGKEDDEG